MSTEPTPTSDTTPAVPETTAPESSAAETPAEKESKAASLRERLKQAQSQETSAVPSIDSSSAPVVPETAPAAADSPQPKQDRPSHAPVEIPRDAEIDDADLEAEIAAALASGEIDALGTAGPQIVEPETTDEESASETPAAKPKTEDELEQGTRLVGKVQSIDDENVFLDLGFRSPGILSLRQFTVQKRPEAGASLKVRVDKYDAAEGLIHVSLPAGRKSVGGDWTSVEAGQVVDCMVTKTNKGGLEVSVSNLRGFMPAGQVDLAYQADLEPYVGQKLTAVVIEANPAKRRLVVSRRSFLEMERKENAQTLWQQLAVGQNLMGTVKTLKEYGAFVDIGGADGFLHIGEISFQRINHPKDVLREGQQIEVQIVTLEPEKSRIGLSLKALQQDPWMIAAETYGVGTTVRGKVSRTTKFGAFVALDAGVEGLIHISELEHRRVNRVTEVLKDGQTVEAKVLSVDPDNRRISLSLKAMTAAPEPVRDEDLAPSSSGEAYTRKRKGPLKGGMGGTGQSGLFGNPNKFG